MDFIKAQYGNGFYKEGMEQDTQLQHKILQGKSGMNNVFLYHCCILIFSLMTTTGTGHSSTSPTTVCRTSCRSSWPRGPGCSTSETGEDWRILANIGLYDDLFLYTFSGVHHKKSNCDSNAGLDKVKSIIKSAQKYLFPSR